MRVWSSSCARTGRRRRGRSSAELTSPDASRSSIESNADLSRPIDQTRMLTESWNWRLSTENTKRKSHSANRMVLSSVLVYHTLAVTESWAWRVSLLASSTSLNWFGIALHRDRLVLGWVTDRLRAGIPTRYVKKLTSSTQLCILPGR